jgi:hypothetical protein
MARPQCDTPLVDSGGIQVGGTACPNLKTCTGAAQYMEQDLKTSSTFAAKSIFTTPNSILLCNFFFSDMNHFTRFCSTFCSSCEKKVMQI